MSYYYTLGTIPHKRHTQFRQPDGSLYHEELMGIHGFVGNKSLLYHLRPPTEVQQVAWTHIQAGHDALIAAPTGSGKTLAAFF